jgi:two-component sensor histidine kinase
MDRLRSKIEGPEVLLSPKQSQVIAMALHELFTNALKYGAFSNESGWIQLNWAETDGAVTVTWREMGAPRTVPPTHRGFGSILLQRTLMDIGGGIDMDFAADGLVCRMEFPLPPAQ